ncbi:unnamed protein product [Ambrosiozyma monospora]|uniref:Unnamed protein product n=1 Tax=Ambrosiozyma monospora TaxID=43982 RepID=A0ACB5T1U9_AMBMO|nr:unnamed protein product [Ambrosiozyma monospora]
MARLPRANLEQKITIIDFFRSSKRSQSEIVDHYKHQFAISTSSFSEWLKNEGELRARYAESKNVDPATGQALRAAKRKSCYKYEEINKAMHKVVEERLKLGLPVTEPVLRRFWAEFAKQFGVTDPKRRESFSHGWLSTFKKRHGLEKRNLRSKNVRSSSLSPSRSGSGNSINDQEKELPPASTSHTSQDDHPNSHPTIGNDNSSSNKSSSLHQTGLHNDDHYIPSDYYHPSSTFEYSSYPTSTTNSNPNSRDSGTITRNGIQRGNSGSTIRQIPTLEDLTTHSPPHSSLGRHTSQPDEYSTMMDSPTQLRHNRFGGSSGSGTGTGTGTVGAGNNDRYQFTDINQLLNSDLRTDRMLPLSAQHNYPNSQNHTSHYVDSNVNETSTNSSHESSHQQGSHPAPPRPPPPASQPQQQSSSTALPGYLDNQVNRYGQTTTTTTTSANSNSNANHPNSLQNQHHTNPSASSTAASNHRLFK